eukprot:4719792-Pyramimonas_sp.AAC.1
MTVLFNEKAENERDAQEVKDLTVRSNLHHFYSLTPLIYIYQGISLMFGSQRHLSGAKYGVVLAHMSHRISLIGSYKQRK